MRASTAARPGASNGRAIAAMLVSQAAFTANDTLIKLAATELPGGEAICIRGVFSLLVALAIGTATGAFGALPSPAQWPVIGLRSFGEVVGSVLYLLALFKLPIASVTAILQFLPLATTAGAALVLGERTGWRRWLATLVGLAGVLVVIRPGGEAFSPWSLVAILGVGFMTVRDLATRRIGGQVSTLLIAALSALSLTLVTALSPLITPWQVPTGRVLLLLGGAALFVFCGYYFIVEAMRSAEIAVVAPFRYSVILWALVSGVLVFGDRPDTTALAGTGLVVAAGLYTVWRERRLARETAGARA